MPNKKIENTNVFSEDSILTPVELKKKYPQTENTVSTVFRGHTTIKNIMDMKDHRIFVVVGPCSIHDINSAMEYADKLKVLADEVEDTLFIAMRVYFEKPRTSLGWQGLINDPFIDSTFKIDNGLEIARKLLLYVAELGLPSAGEALDLITPQYVQDLISWTAIGARTTESQTHRRMASGFSCPVGFKNSTDGNVTVAINAIHSAATSNNFVSIDPEGNAAIIRTKGNPYAHVVLRGGTLRPNYDTVSIELAERELKKAKLPLNIMVDCSHANSESKPENQVRVVEDITTQILHGNRSIMGIMIESNLYGSNQKIPDDLSELKYGISITDKCIDWKTTEKTILKLRDDLKDVLPGRKRN